MNRTALYCIVAVSCLLSTRPAPGQQVRIIGRGPAPAVQPQPGIAPGGMALPPADGDEINMNWAATDGDGKRWDINAQGSVLDGTNDAYDGGMLLQVNGSTFQDTDNKANKLPDRQEIILGPWTYQDKVKVHRQIYVDDAQGYCRWLDLFTNLTDQDITVKIVYRTNHGGSADAVTQADPKQTDNRGMVVAESSQSNRPAVVHLWQMEGFDKAFAVNRQNDNLTLSMDLTIPAGKTVGLCLFNAQRDSADEAREFLNTFNVADALTDLGPAVREAIVNAGGSFVALPGLILNRTKGTDQLALADGARLDGTIMNKTFSLETSLGKVLLPAEKILGGQSIRNGQAVRIALDDGQIIDGRCDQPVEITLADGTTQSLPWWKLRWISYRLGSPRPDFATPARPMLVLRDGQRWAPSPLPKTWTLLSNLGTLTLPTKQIASIRLATEPGQLQQVTLRNGSTLSGLLKNQTLQAQVGPADNISLELISELFVTDEKTAPPNQAVATLRGGDVIRGRVEFRPLDGLVLAFDGALPLVHIKSLRRIPNTRRFKLTDPSGEVHTVELKGKAIGISAGPGLEFTLPVGSLQSLTLPAPEKPAEPGTCITAEAR